MSDVLVTGGSGFLGSHLCDALLSRGQSVLCVDNFFTGSKSNIAHLLGRPDFELLRHDVTFPLRVEVQSIYNLPARHRLSIISMIRSRRPKPASTAPSTCLAWLNG